MSLSPAQLPTLKAAIVADNTLNSKPNNGDGNFDIAAAFNMKASPNYFVWKSSIERKDVNYTVSPDNTVFDFAAYKSQSVAEQGTWELMFMGGIGYPSFLNFRNGVFNIFSGSAPQNAQRAHIFAVCRRLATRGEKLFASAPQSAGGITVGPNNGNTTGDALGSATNPAVMGFEGDISQQDVEQARNLA